MDLFSKCKELYEKIRYFEYGIPVDGAIKPVPSAEYYVKNYHFLKPEEFEKYGGGICWDYVEYERKFLEVNDIDFNQYYIITNTPPNYDTHTFVTVKDGDDLIYIESSFKRVEHIIDGVQKFKSLEDIVKLITTNMWECNGNDKRFDEFKYDVCKFKGHPQYGCTCEEYMKWMDDNSDIVIQDVSINPKKVNGDELTVESCNFFQEGLFNFGKKKEPIDVISKLSETFGELSEAQIDIVSQLNSGIRFTFEIFNKRFYDVLNQAKKLDEFLENELSILKNVQGIANTESILPVGSLGIIPDMNKVLEFYENFEDGNLEYDDMISHMDKVEDGTTRVRVYADRDGKIYSCLSWNGGYTTIAESFEEFINNFSSYTFKLEENSYTVNRRYLAKTGLDVFTDPTAKRRGETIPFKTTYKLDTDDITAVYALQSRFINPWCRMIFDPTTTGDGEIWDFMVDYDSYEEIEKQCNAKGVEEFYTSMKIIEQTFHKPIDHARVKGIYPTKITYVFALNESLDKPFMTVEVESGVVNSVKFNDTTIKEYVDPEEYDEALHDHLEDEDDVYNESWTDFKNGVHPSSGLMFHVSLKNDMDGKTINPQLPSYITDGGKLDVNYQEDTKTKRLCVSPSIEGCMIAILNYKKIREHVGDKFYVYTPEKPFSQYKHKTNKEIVKNKLVFDANITKEAWILEPCKLKLYGIIKLKKVKDLKEKPTVEKGIKMNTIKLDYEWIMTPKASGKFNKAIGDSPDEESDKKEKPIKEYAVPGSFYHDIKPHPGGVYALVEDDSYRSHFCHMDFQGHDNKYLGWNAPTGSELILKTQEVIKSEKWEFRKSETDTVIPEYTHIFTYAQQILPIIRLDKIKDRLNELLAPHCPLTVHDPNSDTDIEYVCIQPQQYEVIDKKQTSYVYDTAYKHMFENHIVYLPIVDNLGMFEVKHTTHVAGTYDDNLFFEELFYGPTISYKLFDAFKDLNSVTLYDISDINAWDFACGYEDHYDEDGERIEPGDPKHPSNKSVTESTNVLVSNEEFFMESQTTRNKVLERLKYDPATQTIDTGVKDVQTGNNIRIKLKISSTKIDPELNKNGGAQFTKIVYDRPSSLYEMLSDSRCCIKVESNLLNQRNNSALATIYHEIGHLVDWIATKYGNHLSNEDKQTCYRILNFLNKKADYFDRSDTNAHLNRRETFADKFANTKISSQALNKSNEKTDRKIMNDAYSEYKKFKKNKEYTKARENSLRHDKHELGSQLRSQLISSKMESSNILVSNEEFFMEANKNYEKALKILDYDPKTNTIKGNIPLPDGSTKERVLFVINSPLVNGACVASLDFYKNDLENKIRESEPGSKERNELEKHRELINNASRGKKDYEEFIVCMPRKNLKERNIGGVVSAMHEVGHVNYWCNTSKNNQQKARDFINKNKIDELTYNGPNHEHAIDSDEYLADDFAAKRTSKHASKKHISKLSLNDLQKIYGEVKHRRKQLDVLKSKINPSKFEKDENAYLDALEKTYILMDEVEQLEDQLSKAYDLPKTPENETILNQVKKEYINLKNKQARTNESKDSKLNVVVMNERLNENIESFEKSIDEILYNIQSIKTEYNKRKEFVDKDLIKNVQESCFIMDNDEFFGLTE